MKNCFSKRFSLRVYSVAFGLSWIVLDSLINFDNSTSADIRNCIVCIGFVMIVLRTLYYLSMTSKFGPIAIALINVWKDIRSIFLREIIALEITNNIDKVEVTFYKFKTSTLSLL